MSLCCQTPNFYDPILAPVIVSLTMKAVANSMNIDQRKVVLKGSADCSEPLSDTLKTPSALIGQGLKELQLFMSA